MPIETNELFYALIRVSIGTQEYLPRMPKSSEWRRLYKLSRKQSLLGICSVGVEKTVSFYSLPDWKGMEGRKHSRIRVRQETYSHSGITLPAILYLKWMNWANLIRLRNGQMNGYTKKVVAHFMDNGFQCMPLKGQSMVAIYKCGGTDLRHFRQPGDVDVWVAGGRKKLYKWSLKKFGKLNGLTYHHIHYPLLEDVEVEAHVWPSFLSDPICNYRLHRFFKAYEPDGQGYFMRTLAFNRVYILLHCYRHFCGHGVGFRQLMDYYFVLKKGFSENEREEAMGWITRLGMKRFAMATMWLCKEIFGMEKQYLLCEPDENYGRFLLDEVMQTGNMGHADERVNHKMFKSAFRRYQYNLKRDFRLMKICPREALWDPFFNVYQYFFCRICRLFYKSYGKTR